MSITCDMAKSSFPERLRALREKKDWKQADLARASGLSQGLISLYESGKNEPLLSNLMILANALHCTLEDLTGIEALRGAEEKIPQLSEDALSVATFFESLPDSDPLKAYLKQLIEQSRPNPGTEQSIDKGHDPSPPTSTRA